jgi:tRNA A-37 threonylcarbamoyl transferase component Bud32
MIKSFNKIKCKLIKKGHNPVCILTVKTIKVVDDITLMSGKYILKNITKEKISNKDINLLKSLSDSKLIPKIYFIDKNKIIMDYFDGITLQEYLKRYKLSEKLNQKIRKLVFKWHRLGYAHGDLALLFSSKTNKLVGAENLLISDKEIILIDPLLGKVYDDKLSQFEIRKKWDIQFLKELKFYINRSIKEVFELTK